MNDHLFQAKSQRTYDKSRLPPGWLDCPTYGQEIGGIVPSKVPLGEAYNDCIAIRIFSEARPPGIYKPDYIDVLYAFYHEQKPDKVTCPPTPEWKRSSEFDLNGEAIPDEDDDGETTF
ncbi:putative polynucleotide 5'-phosphatase, mRNA guanylyltransferase [Helianthus annuus]|nr:putative polynucleotide 5'-phosphatase, mRNA guanylyltransferase [Helianthus annuus]